MAGNDPTALNAHIQGIARKIVTYRLGVPAIFFISCARPLNVVVSQFLLFMQPVLSLFFRPEAVDALAETFSERESVEKLLSAIEQFLIQEEKGS